MVTVRRAVVIVGSDTGVGKTFVGCALARTLVALGRAVVAIKPVETGCSDEPLPTEDGVQLARATGQVAPRLALWRFRRPIAAAIAAELEGAPLELAPLLAAIERSAAAADLLLVEGAGGLLSPLSWNWNLVDLARALDAIALIVASDRLGCINHTLLTVGALDRAGIPVAGVVLSAPAVPDASTGENAAALGRLLPERRIVAVPRMSSPNASATRLAEVAQWLCR